MASKIFLTNFFSSRRALAIPPKSEGPYAHERCRMYSGDWAKALAEGRTTPDDEWAVVPCMHGWEYNRSDVPYHTIASDVSIILKQLNCSKNRRCRLGNSGWSFIIYSLHGWKCYSITWLGQCVGEGRTTLVDEWPVVSCIHTAGITIEAICRTIGTISFKRKYHA